jgi:hypothetical protein
MRFSRLQQRLHVSLVCLLCISATVTWADCADREAGRRAYFGDIHVHTRFSQDANWRMGNTEVGPNEAYQFARGARLSLPPYDTQGGSVRSLQLDRPLDFMAVTDHAEALGEVRLCEDPAYDGPGAWLCGAGVWKRLFAGFAAKALPVSTLCPPGNEACDAAARAAWRDTLTAAATHNSPCEFSTFVGYEWSGLAGMANLHRNVIFRSSNVVSSPISAREARTPEALWDALDAACRDGVAECEAITIPHNPNLSEGLMFAPTLTSGDAMTARVAQQRQRYERLVEIVQHKGASECFGGVGSEDELCAFERLPYSNFLQKYLPFMGEMPADDSRYIREALREGLRQQQRLDINPFMTGFTGGTDTHTGTGGAVDESGYTGNHGAQHVSAEAQLPDRVEQNPGGLAVLYAEQNTRESLFKAMQRREAYATSGTRIQLRFFGGWHYSDDLCEQADQVGQAYAGGVPMGGELQSADGNGRAPAFMLSAQADPGTAASPGGLIQRMQVIKAWVDEQGNSRERVFDVAGSADNGAGVNLANCEAHGEGYQSLCTVWRDPEFNASRNAVYYSRVVENPSCRWQQRICVDNQVSCEAPDSLPEGLQGCCDDSVPRTVQERAWSSPIWYSARPASVQP